MPLTLESHSMMRAITLSCWNSVILRPVCSGTMVKLNGEHGKARNHLEVAQVRCGDAIVQFEGGNTDQKVRDCQMDTFGFVFAIYLACAQGNRNRHGMNRHGEQQIVEKFLVIEAPLWRVGACDAVGKLKDSDDRDRDFFTCEASGQIAQRMTEIVASPLFCYEDAGVENQSHWKLAVNSRPVGPKVRDVLRWLRRCQWRIRRP